MMSFPAPGLHVSLVKPGVSPIFTWAGFFSACDIPFCLQNPGWVEKCLRLRLPICELTEQPPAVEAVRILMVCGSTQWLTLSFVSHQSGSTCSGAHCLHSFHGRWVGTGGTRWQLATLPGGQPLRENMLSCSGLLILTGLRPFLYCPMF